MDGGLHSVLTRRRLPPAFERWRLTLAPGNERATDATEWTDALVMVESGILEAECTAGGTQTFRAGDVIAPGWLPVCRLRNPGVEPMRLVAVRRVRE